MRKRGGFIKNIIFRQSLPDFKTFNFKSLHLIIPAVLIISCGIEEYYYLPQVPEGNISVQFTSFASINIPAITESYASGYIIYYRIYLSDRDLVSFDNLSVINPYLLNDFNLLFPYTDPSNNTLVTTANTFSNRNYYELNYTISRNGGRLEINFPTFNDSPTASLDGGAAQTLRRAASLLNTSLPRDDPFFRSRIDLRTNAYATSAVNADVAPMQGSNPPFQSQYAYAAMYIAAIGQNNSFTRIYSKPTFIGVFRLPEANF